MGIDIARTNGVNPDDKLFDQRTLNTLDAAQTELRARLESGMWRATAIWNTGRAREIVPAGWWVGADFNVHMDTAEGHCSSLTGIRVCEALPAAGSRRQHLHVDVNAVCRWMEQEIAKAHQEGRRPTQAEVIRNALKKRDDGGMDCNQATARRAYSQLPEGVRNRVGRPKQVGAKSAE